MNVKEAKDIDISEYLAKLGYTPRYKRGINYWYLSMLPERSEKTPSFKVNTLLNRWIDFGSGQKGSIIDFGVFYHRCSVSDFLKILSGSAASVRLPEVFRATVPPADSDSRLIITNVKDLQSPPLLRFLDQRRISFHIATQYCREVNYQVRGKSYYAIGFPNSSGGFELRNAFIKASSSPKASSFIDNGAADLAVFEGFFNFLSYKTIYDRQDEPLRNYLILNSAALFNKNLPLMRRHALVHLYLDNDRTGQNCIQKGLATDATKFIDERGLYQGHKDLNDWLIHIGQDQRARHEQRQDPTA